MEANDRGRGRDERAALIRQGRAEEWRHEEYGYHDDEPPSGDADFEQWLVEIAPEAPPREEPEPTPTDLIRQLFVTWTQERPEPERTPYRCWDCRQERTDDDAPCPHCGAERVPF
jgi:hypothetical protein